jgi:hypothetical protein
MRSIPGIYYQVYSLIRFERKVIFNRFHPNSLTQKFGAVHPRLIIPGKDHK